MHIKIYFAVATTLLLTAKGDPDPLTLTLSTPAPFLQQSSQEDPREVLVYLTQDQITALQTRDGILEPELEPQLEDDQENDNYDLEQEVDQQKDYFENRPFVIIQNQKKISPAPVKEQNQEESEEQQQKEDNKYQFKRPVSERTEGNKYNVPTFKQLENERYFVSSTERPDSIFFASTTEKIEDLSSYNYYNVHNEKKGDNINIKIIHPNTKNIKSKTDLEENKPETPNSSLLHKIYKLIPSEYIRGKQSDAEPTQGYQAIQKDGKRKLGPVYAPVQREESKSQENEQENVNENEEGLDEENEPKYTFEYEKRQQALNILDSIRKQSAEADAADRRPVTKKVSSIARKVPVLQRYKVFVPQRDAIKVPQPYPAPLEIVRHIPIEIQENDQEEEKQIPYKVEKRLPAPAARRVYVKVERPYIVERVVPVERRKGVPVKKTQKLTILGPTLQYYN